jgi:hypothetical protein
MVSRIPKAQVSFFFIVKVFNRSIRRFYRTFFKAEQLYFDRFNTLGDRGHPKLAPAELARRRNRAQRPGDDAAVRGRGCRNGTGIFETAMNCV